MKGYDLEASGVLNAILLQYSKRIININLTILLLTSRLRKLFESFVNEST